VHSRRSQAVPLLRRHPMDWQANLVQAVLFHDREWIDIFLY
jgi:hypothetical protein